MKTNWKTALLAAGLLASTFAHADERDHRQGNRGKPAGAVFTLSNETSGNAVQAFRRNADGTLSMAESYPTGGLGTGTGLGSQGALTLSRNGRWLFAVNAGSNEITSFEVHGAKLELISRVSSGGMQPISVTHADGLVYVVHAGGQPNITGFTVDCDGRLSPLPDSTRPLSGPAPGPAQIQFNPSGDVLVVTEKATSLINVYTLDRHGRAHGPEMYPSSGQTPFGFDFTPSGQLVVSEAFSGMAGKSAVSSYSVSDDEDEDFVQLLSGSVPDFQTAACWLVTSPKGHFAYTANAGSGTVSGYAIDRKGQLTLLEADGRSAFLGEGSHPIDLAMSRNGKFLYALDNVQGFIAAFQVTHKGQLEPIGNAGKLPASVVGLAAR